MFDWFKDMANEFAGIDSTAARKEVLEKKEAAKSERYIFSKRAKTTTVFLAIIYIIMSGTTISMMKNIEGSILIILKNIFMSIVAIFIIFALIFGKKKGEVAALIGIFVFVVGLFLSIVFM